MRIASRLVALVAAMVASVGVGAAEDYIWVEGEAARNPQVKKHPWWYDQVKKPMLSGDEWLHNFGDADGTGDYRFEAPADGQFDLWVRANHIGASLSYQLNGGAWTPVDFSKKRDDFNIAADDKPDMRFISWTPVGKVTLKKGPNDIVFKFHSGNQHHGGLDCFVLTQKSFAPSGELKPGQKLGLANEGMWAFEPDADTFDAAAVFDLRTLNEKVAGESGWLKRTPDGDFALGNGKKTRIWAVNSNAFDTLETAKEHARFLAKRGVNMVRLHCHLNPDPNEPLEKVNTSQLDQIFRAVAACRAEGIYVTISPFWATSGIGAGWNLHGRKDGALFGLLFWDPKFQAAYKGWIKELFTRVNPHTKLALAQDPSFGIFQIQNEDSLLFWTIQQVKGEEKRALGKLFAAWATKKHGSLEKTQAAWDNAGGDGDDFANGVIGLIGMWEYQGGFEGGKGKRLADQLQFFSETMHTFNADIGKYVRDELKCPVLVNAGNWRTANQVKMLDCERWSYTANEVQGVNRYIGGAHINPTEGHKAGYLVAKGDLFTELSCLTSPRSLAVNGKQVVGFPYIISESTWVPPISYQAEGPLLVAAYSALNGVDAYYWFAHGEVGFDRGYNKWQSANAAMMGGWPGAALLFRKDYIKRGAPAVHEERTLDDLWNARGILMAEEEGFDPNRDTKMPTQSSVKSGADPLAYLVGPVEAVYGGDPAKNAIADTSKLIDNAAKTVTSITGELKLDHGKGIFTMDAPKAQGVAGFLAKGAGSWPLATVTFESKAEYAALLAVPLDDKELKDSAKVLVQVTTICRPYGWKVTPTTFEQDKKPMQGFRIDDTGSSPWNVAKVAATVTVKNAKLKKATVLDANGMRGKEVPATQKGGALTVTLPQDAMYVVLE